MKKAFASSDIKNETTLNSSSSTMNKRHKINFKMRVGMLCLAGGILLPHNLFAQEDVTAVEEEDTTYTGPEVLVQTEEGYKPALPKSALEYMLQKPRVSKRYDKKRFGDHLFLEMGLGANFIASHHDKKVGPQIEVKIGDWATPEHGWRVGATVGAYKKGLHRAKFFEVSPDYMMNLTAVANRFYPNYKRFELYGFAGFDFAYSQERERVRGRLIGQSFDDFSLGFHLGFHGQFEITRNTYVYLEPSLGMATDDLSKAYTHYNWRPMATLSAGFGYRISEPMHLRQHIIEERAAQIRQAKEEGYYTNGHKKFADGMFISLAGGYSMLTSTHPAHWAENDGNRFAFMLGKWLDPYQGVRLGVNMTTLNQKIDIIPNRKEGKMTNFGIQADYMLNLHNMFVGLSPNRHWWINYLIGASANFNSTGKTTFGVGTGLQGNVRLSKAITFYIEPRIDIYQENYAYDAHSLKKMDLVGSVLGGFTYTYKAKRLKELKESRENFTTTTWHDHMFVESGAGLNMPLIDEASKNLKGYARPYGYAGVGKWFNTLHGSRLWLQVSRTKYNENMAFRHAEMGLDYMFNFTNAFMGYDENRKGDIVGGLGVNASVLRYEHHLNIGAQAFVRGTYHVNPLLGIFIEPRITGYGHHYYPSDENAKTINFIASAVLGLQFKMQEYNKPQETAKFDSDGGRHGSFYIAGGFAVPAYHMKDKAFYGPEIRAGYTNWFNPLSAWRISLQGIIAKRAQVWYDRHKYAEGKIGADYMFDVTAHTYGYDPDRVLSLYGIMGANVGFDYKAGKTYINGDIHFGGQMAFLVAENTHIFVEADMAYRLSKRFSYRRNERYLPQGLIGIDYGIKRNGKISKVQKDEKHRFITASVGTGMSSLTVTNMHPYGRKHTINAEFAYGSWYTGVHGWQMGLSNTTINVHKTKMYGSKCNITSFHLAYVMNIRAALSGETTEYKKLQVTGIAGPSLNFTTRKGSDTSVAPGLKLAFQAGLRLTPSFDIYLQPSGMMYTNKIMPNKTGHTIDGQLDITIGTRYRF